MRKYPYPFLFQFIFILPVIFDYALSQSSILNIPLPSNDFHRIETDSNSFAELLRDLPLKKPGSAVENYRGGIFKAGTDTSVAFVVNIDIKGRRLEQCMDILVRLYAEYLWKAKRVENLMLPLPGGYWLRWEDWHEGIRPEFKGIDVKMRKTSKPDTSLKAYRNYLNTVYGESHTQQFYHAYQPVDRTKVEIGDIIVKKGTKGHAVIIVDLAKNDQGEMIALIGNGDTPACQFFILKHHTDSPWIPLKFDRETLDLPLRRKMSWDGLRRFSLPKD
jgi:hypothetical protein